MKISKWFIRAEEIFPIKNLYLLHVTADVMNDFETDENRNYWKYCSYDKIREKLVNKYQISQDHFIVLYTKEKLMIAARFAWLLYWIGFENIKILIGKLDPSLVRFYFPLPSKLPDVPLRPTVRLTCSELSHGFHPPTTKFIDVRTYREYSGEITGYPYIRRAGRIPNFQFHPLDGIYGQINGDISWNELDEYLKLMSRIHKYDRITKKLYICVGLVGEQV